MAAAQKESDGQLSFNKGRISELEDKTDMRRERRQGVQDKYRIWSGYKVEDSRANGPNARRQF